MAKTRMQDIIFKAKNLGALSLSGLEFLIYKYGNEEEAAELALLRSRIAELEAGLARVLRLEEYSFVLPNQATGKANVESTIKAFDEARTLLANKAQS